MTMIIALDPKNSSVESGQPFPLVVKFKTDREGLSANLRAVTPEDFLVEPAEQPLPKSPEATSETIQVIVTRLRPGLEACLIRGTLGRGSPAHCMVFVR